MAAGLMGGPAARLCRDGVPTAPPRTTRLHDLLRARAARRWCAVRATVPPQLALPCPRDVPRLGRGACAPPWSRDIEGDGRRTRPAFAFPASADRRDPRGGVGCLRRRRQPLRQPRLPGGAGGQRQRGAGTRLAAPARRPARRGRHAAGLRALLCQVAFPGRIRLRPWLGRCAGTRGRPVLPEIAGLRAVLPGARAAAAGPSGRRGAARRAGPGADPGLPGGRRVIRPCHLLHGGRMDRARRGRLAAAPRHAVPLDQSGLSLLRRFPRRAGVAQAQGAEAGDGATCRPAA